LFTLTVAHVFGHTDFFKHNIWFGETNRQMVESVSQNAQRIRQYTMDEGSLEVEQFLDAVLALSDHIDPYQRRAPQAKERAPSSAPAADLFSDLFPATSTSSSLATGRPLKGQPKGQPLRKQIPEAPEKDLLRFLLEHGEFADWQRDVLAIVREESLYFVPQMQTKIINEGWASYWHTRIMREIALTDDEFLEFGRLHSGVCTPGRTRINPYYVGFKMFEDIERRFGRAKLFEVREMENDVSFLRTYLTEELCHDLDLFTFALDDENEWAITSKQWEHVRDTLCESMTNFGQPYLEVEDGDYGGRHELYLRHRHDGRDLDFPYAERTLMHLAKLWGHQVHLETLEGQRSAILTCNGDQVVRAYV
jgi:stage V sporulation protein R